MQRMSTSRMTLPRVMQAKAARLLRLTPRQIGYALKKFKVEVKAL